MEDRDRRGCDGEDEGSAAERANTSQSSSSSDSSSNTTRKSSSTSSKKSKASKESKADQADEQGKTRPHSAAGSDREAHAAAGDRRNFGRSADAAWDWGPRCSSGLGFRFTPVKDRESGAISAMQLLCRHPNHRAEGVCTKRRNTHAGVDIVIRQLKWWALQGLHKADREAHRDLWKAIEETPVTELPEDSVLNDQCPRSFDGAA